MAITESDITAYFMSLDDDDLCYEGPPPFCGNLKAEAKAMAECNTVPEYIERVHAYLHSPEGEAFLEARSAVRLQRLEASKAAYEATQLAQSGKQRKP